MGETSQPFSKEEYWDRQDRLRGYMAGRAIDLMYLTSPESMCYLHGYAARWYRGHSPIAWPPLAGTAVHVDHERFIHFDFPMEEELLRRTSIAQDIRFLPGEERLDSGIPYIMRELKGEGWLTGTVGMEHWSHVPNRAVSEVFEQAFIEKGCRRVVDATRPIRGLRRVKSAQEIEYIERAAQICDIAHRTIAEILRAGVSELEVYGEAMRAMAYAGGETSAIDGVISSGPYMAGHALSSRRRIEPGDHILADLCGVFNRYHANIERGFYVGEPSNGLIDRYERAGRAFEVLSHVASAGAQIVEVNRALREYYKSEGIWDVPDKRWVGGYELGISFSPDWVGEFVFSVEDENPDGAFEEGMVTNFESTCGTNLIDTFVYEAHTARRLSETPAELIIVDI